MSTVCHRAMKCAVALVAKNDQLCRRSSAMKIVVLGGSGLIGSRLVQRLRARGHDVVAASPKTGVNAFTGEGLVKALEKTHIVVDVMNAPSWEDDAVMNFFNTTTRNILAAAKETGIRHYVALSVVGTERLQASGYFRAKLAQENLIQSSKTPYTIVRATQFFEFLAAVADYSTVDGTVRLSPVHMQPISADDVATAIADFSLEKPANGIVEIAGPEAMGIDAAVCRVLRANGDQRPTVTDSQAKYYGLLLSDQALMPGKGVHIGTTHLMDWLAVSEQPSV
jgi:uncharacterized protein YbjT (DUF2867 family)